MSSLRSTIITTITTITTAFAGYCRASWCLTVGTITITIITTIIIITIDVRTAENGVLRGPVFCPLFLAAFFLCRPMKMPIGAVEHDLGR
jgi:hypothetical protein